MLYPNRRFAVADVDTVEELPTVENFEVVYCILGAARKQPAETLPFFSQLTLVRAYTDLVARGFRVSILGVKPESP